jgi:hypothetical protein
MLSKIKKAIFSFSLLVPFFASAQVTGGTVPNINLPLLGGGSFTGLAAYIINLGLGIAGILAILFLIYGGFRYITSAGNEEQAETAKKIILNSIIGIVVIILSYTIITVIANALISNRP